MLNFGDTGLLESDENIGVILTDLEKWSISFWYFRTESTGANHISLYPALGAASGWRVRINGALMTVEVGSTVKEAIFLADTGSTQNELEHWCLSWDGAYTAAGMRFYRNGIDVGTTLIDAGNGTRVFGDPQSFKLQLEGATTGAEAAHVGIWNRPLSPFEALALSRHESPLSFPNELLGYWVCDHETGIEPDLVGDITLIASGSLSHVLRDVYVTEPYPRYEWAPASPVVATDPVFARSIPLARRLG